MRSVQDWMYSFNQKKTIIFLQKIYKKIKLILANNILYLIRYKNLDNTKCSTIVVIKLLLKLW